MTEQQKTRLIGFGLVLVASIFNGLIPSSTQYAMKSGLSIETILVVRYFIGTGLLWLYIFLGKKSWQVSGELRFFMILLGVLLFGATTVINESYKYLPGAVAQILVFLYVVIVVIIEIFTGNQRIVPKRILCLIAAFLGLLFVVWPWGAFSDTRLLGSLLALGGAFFYALQTLGLGSNRLRNVDAVVITGYMNLFIFMATLLRCLLAGEPLLPQEATPWWPLLTLGVGAAFVAPVAFCLAVKKIGASDTSLTNTSEPVFAYLAGILIMSDRISWNATFGGIMVLSSVVLLNMPGKRRRSEPPR
jgi:drug/metabolite transporter (DMT)-like permease